MSSLREPRLETRRKADLSAELFARAKAWLPDWRPRDPASDVAGALFEIFARIESEVAQRLDKMPEKVYRGFLDWLGVRGQAPQAAQLPLVFALTPGAQNSQPVLAQAPVNVQATPPQTSNGPAPEPVTFETEDDVMIVPGSLAALVASDPATDSFYQAPSGFSALQAPTPGPTSWTVKTAALAGSTQIQLDPALGLDSLPSLYDAKSKILYNVTQAQGGLVTVDPPVGTADTTPGAPAPASTSLNVGDVLTLQSSFQPFGGPHRNLQEHDIYIGSESLLNLPTAASISINGISATDIAWTYWGKIGTSAMLGWQTLTPDTSQTTLTLTKTAGSVELLSIGGKSSRWLKGTKAPGSNAALTVSHISLLLNSQDCGQTTVCPPLNPPATPIALDGIANTTPLVLNTAFYPLGREPRLFDSFYLGCPEAFSKKNASVKICFQALDATAVAYSAVHVTASSPATALFGIGTDGFLHRMRPGTTVGTPISALAAVRPPLDQSGQASVKSSPVALTPGQGRLSLFPRSGDTLVAAIADKDVWIWSENPDSGTNGKWYFIGTPAKNAVNARSAAPLAPAVLLLADTASIHAVVLSGGALYEASLAPGWETAAAAQWTKIANPNSLTWAGIAPVFDQDSPTVAPPVANGWIAVADDGSAFLFTWDGAASSSFKPLPAVTAGIRPLAMRPAATGAPAPLFLMAATPDGNVTSWTVVYDADTPPKQVQSAPAVPLGNSFDWTISSGNGVGAIFTTAATSGDKNLAAWYPLSTGKADPTIVYLSPPAAALAGSPAIVPSVAAAPGANGSIVTFSFDPDGIVQTSVLPDNLATAFVIQNAPDHPRQNDVAIVKLAKLRRKHYVLAEDATANGPNRYWMKVPGSEGAKGVDSIVIYRRDPSFTGSVTDAAPTQITQDVGDPNSHKAGDLILVTFPVSGKTSVHSIVSTDPVAGVPTLTIQPKITGISGTETIAYQYLNQLNFGTQIFLLPLLTQALPQTVLDALKWNGAYFHGASPAPNPQLFADSSAAIASIVFAQAWDAAHPPQPGPGGNFALHTEALFGSLLVLAQDKSSNPALSWEYFDGNAWWKIPKLVDLTSNLLSTGTVSFCVPFGLQQTDVAGRKSYWIRARLVGGDYGQETVTVYTKPDPSNPSGTIQTIDRSQSGINPPLIGAVNLTYAVCCAADPDFVMTSDGGNLRDQTSANQAATAQIDLFPSLTASIQAASTSITSAEAASGPAFFLGFDGPISGGPINILFLVDDNDFEAAYPLRVDVLTETGFAPLTPDDGTRGLGETGILSLYIPDTPPPATLFGSALHWIRIRPAQTADSATWTPTIRSAYVNAVYALASQTQERERLGSSDGSPGQVVTVALPPVLQGSLELRVLEPLGEEDITALNSTDPNTVIAKLDPTAPDPPPNTPPQSWVLWKEIDIIEEAGKTDRVYSLDTALGDITFGDGMHGMIPSIGQDSIVARLYKRGGGSAANLVKAWSEINLVSPIPGVSQVVAPYDAAGGSDAQTPDEIIRLAPSMEYMRDRALTLRDFEMLAVQSSRDIVQARALSAPGGVRLIAVARQKLLPTEAQWRGLLAFLVDRCPPSLAAPGAIAKVPPRLLRVQVTLTLDIASLEFTGAVAQAATSAISNLFDPATGGFDHQGWPLGVLPTETDIAGALDDIPNLLGVDSLTLTVTADGASVTAALPQDLPVAAAADILCQFQVVQLEVGA